MTSSLALALISSLAVAVAVALAWGLVAADLEVAMLYGFLSEEWATSTQ